MEFTDTLFGRESTVRNQTYMFNKWIKPYPPHQLEQLLRRWQRAGLAPRTQTFLLSLAVRYTEHMHGTRPKNAAKLRRAVSMQVPADPVKSLTKKNAQKLLGVWEALYPEHLGLFLMGYHCGMRISEALNLKRRDVDFGSGHIRITGLTKSGRPRLIPMSHLVEQTLQKTDNLIAGGDLSAPVFSSIKVNPRLKTACNLADIEPITFHWLRHTFATLALESGASLRTVSEILGHAHVSTTMNTYWHVLQQRIDLGFLDE